jgi:hypothetical protein
MKKKYKNNYRKNLILFILAIILTAFFVIPITGNTLNIIGVHEFQKIKKANPGPQPIGQENWWNNAWSYKKNIIINHLNISSNLGNFPLLINLSNSNFDFSHAKTNGGDIRFINYEDNSTEFYYEIDYWNSSSMNAYIWVNITNISNTTDSKLWMYYGNPSASDNQTPINVWDTNFRMVHHFSEVSGTHYDSTSNNNDGAPYNSVVQNVIGIIGSADEFNGTNNYVMVPDSSSLDLSSVFTLEGWIKPSSAQSGVGKQPFNKPDSYVYSYDHGNPSYRGTVAIKTSTGSWPSPGGPVTVSQNQWYHVVGVYNGTNLITYIDGVQKAISTDIGAVTLSVNSYNFFIGCGLTPPSTPSSFFGGVVDEVRVSAIARSSSWVNASYQAIKNTLLIYGTEEALPGINHAPNLSSESPANNTINVPKGSVVLQINANDAEGNLMNITFKTNASGNWMDIDTNSSVGNGTYQQIYSFTDYDTTYWWSVNATDAGSGNWTNQTYLFTTAPEPGVHKFSIDHNSHINYGLAYPVTYIFTIPSGISNLKAYKIYPGEIWNQIPEKNASDIFSGVEAVRFNYSENKAYVSATFPANSDDFYIKITDVSGNIQNVNYIGIAEFYDNRSVAVVITSDDWLTCPLCSNPDSTNYEFKKVCDACQERNIWYTPGINSNGTLETGWYPNPDYGPNWTVVQQQIDEGFVELAAHSRNHPHTPYDGSEGDDGYDEEIGGCKQDILENVTMPALNRRGEQEYLYTWIEPYGNSDSTVRQKLGEYYYICDRSTASGATSFSAWDATNNLYDRAGYTVLWDSSSTASLNSAFDSVHNSGGIYLIYGHPFQLNFDPNGHVYQHLNYLANRSDVWYAGMGHLYLYHYMEDRNVITYSIGSGNMTPSISFESPSDGSTNVSAGLVVLKINATDIEGDLMNITFRTNASGNWIDIGTNNSVETGTYQQTYSFTNFDTTYWWSVNATDPNGSGGWTNRTFSFTTMQNNPVVSDPLPVDFAFDVSVSLSELSFNLEDYQGDKMNYTVETLPDIGNGTGENVSDGRYSVSADNLTYNTLYNWFVNVTDGLTWTNKIFTFTTELAPGVWWNENWFYRKEIVINHSNVDDDLTNFPVLIDTGNYGDSDLTTHAQSDGDDFVFTDYYGNKLNHEIELYNHGIGWLIAWVNITNLSSTQDTILYMYYGNTGCSNQENSTGVWDSHYRIVQHLGETSGIHYDSTVYGNNGTCYNGVVMDTAGIVDGADSFDGSNDYIGIPNNPSLALTSVTVEAWCKTTISATVEPVICKDYDGSSVLFRIDIGTTDSANGFGFFDGAWHTTAIAGTERNGYWHHLVGTYDGSALKYYVDGSLINTVFYIGGLPSNTAPVYIARYQTYYSNCTIDEVRVSNPVRNASWIATEYKNQNDPSSFYNIGNQESLGNQTPVISSESPIDSSTNIPVGLITLQITVDDPENDQMNITFRTNASGYWADIGTNISVGDGTYQQTYNFQDYETRYWWSVNVTDPDGSGNWVNETYSFTTQQIPRDWIYYKKLTINHSLVDTDLINFPVLVNISSDTDLANHTQNDGDDIRFFDESNTTQLNHEIEYFNSTTGKLVCWVNVTFLSSTQDTIIWMSYGNTTCASQQNSTGVWDSNYRMVQHLSETSGTHQDSTSYDNDGICYNSVNQNVDGIIAGADSFSGSNYCEVTDDTSLDLTNIFSLEGWINSDLPQSGTLNMQPFNKPDSYIYSYFHTADAFRGVAALHTNTGSWYSSNEPVTITEDNWHYITGVYDGTNLRTYVDGEQKSSNSIGSVTLETNNHGFLIGCGWSTTGEYMSFFDGSIDEVRVSSIARNSSWINTSYNEVNSSDSFITVGNENILLPIDTIPPEITNVLDEPDPQEIGGYVNITCDVTDNEVVDEVWVNITYPNNSYHNQTMSGGSYYYNTTYNQMGTYEYFIWANDTSGNANISAVYNFYIYNLSIVYVDDDYNSYTSGWGYDHFDTIQNGINAVASSGVIYVYNGIYDEQLLIDKQLTVIGEDLSSTVLQPTAVPTWGVYDIKITANYVILRNFTLDFNGPADDRGGATGDTGIVVSDENGPDATGVEILNNIIYTGHEDTALETGKNATVSDLLIGGNVFYCDADGMGEGVYINPGPGTSIRIDDNEFYGNVFSGITVEANNVNISNNVVDSDVVTGSYGIRFIDTVGSQTYSNMIIYGNTLRNMTYGVRIGTSTDLSSNLTVSVINNQINNCSTAIWVRYGANLNNSIHNNNLSNNINYGIKMDSPDNVNAEYNWWGAAIESEISDYIWDYHDNNNLGLVDFDPWYIDETMTTTATHSNVYIIYLQEHWNLISLPFNESKNKSEIFISYNGDNYTWNEAVINGYILNFIYGWNATSQTYEIYNTLEPGYGYWIWTYYECSILIFTNAVSDEYLTSLSKKWNTIGLPGNISILKEDVVIQYNGTDYSWYEATTNNNEEGEPLILSFIYGWNEYTQNYILSEYLEPGNGYWMYAFYNCILKKY